MTNRKRSNGSNRSKNIGSVSCATMRTEDLIPSFIYELESQRPLKREHRKMLREIKRRMNATFLPHDHQAEGCSPTGLSEPESAWSCGVNADAENYYGTDDADYDLNEFLFPALDEYCLPYFYFGSHPGDGADYGYWLSEEWEEQLEENGGIKVNDLADVPKGFTGDVAVVNDHGNVSLYRYARGRGREVWSIV